MDAALRDLFADFGSGDGMVAGCQVLHRAVRNARHVQLAGLVCRRDRRTLPQRFARQEPSDDHVRFVDRPARCAVAGAAAAATRRPPGHCARAGAVGSAGRAAVADGGAGPQ
ncbi:hypothetical protein XAP6164_1410012 [Xanthomonas phaseoli pv. phaseoli]|nr:hypothetical protein XAP6164_1410012 [Xanthomonas phaseoli pv. phaseoli]